MLNKTLLTLFVITALGCKTGSLVIPNTEECTVAGVFAAGAFCAESITGKTRDLSLDEFFDFLEPKEADPTGNQPARAGAYCRSAEDHLKLKTILEQACRLLGNKCTYEIQQTIQTMNMMEQRVFIK